MGDIDKILIGLLGSFNDVKVIVLLLSEISPSMAWKTKKLASRTFIHNGHVFP